MTADVSGADQYNPELLPSLEQSVEAQVRGGTYNLASNLALLRLYIFYPESTNIKVVSNILVKALMALPEGDFALCMDLIPQKTQSDATITALSTLASHLELAKFKDFWAAAEPLSDLLGAVPGFADAARAYICALHGDVYRRCPKAVLREALNLPQAEFDALVQKRCAGANAWKLAGENIEFPFEEAAQQQQPSAAAEVIPLGKVEALFSKQAVAAA